MTQPASRRYDIDALRVIAFGLLIFYHIGMFYVSWDWHVKSRHAGETGEPLMLLLNPWRLSLLFFISGFALRFAIDKTRLASFAVTRTWRLFLPILFGMLVIVTPQSWLQLTESREIDLNLWQFYPGYLLDLYSITTPTWNHLWYVVYILVYTLLIIPAARPLSRFMVGRGEAGLARVFGGRSAIIWVMAGLFVPHMAIRIFLDPHFPTTHDLVSDWANHAHSFTWFLTGFLLAKSTAFRSALQKSLPLLWGLALILAIGLSWYWSDWDAHVQAGHNLWPARTARVLYICAVILALLAAADRWLNRLSPWLSYMTEAIFSWYILHQTLIIMAGYYLTRLGLPAGIEFAGVVLATVLGCALIHEYGIRRNALIRPLFGLKAARPRPDHGRAAQVECNTVNPAP